MKKLAVFLLCGMLAASLAACGTENGGASQTNVGSLVVSDSTQIPNPWTECSTLDEAMEKAGFYIDVPKQQDGYTTRNVRVIPGELISITDTGTDTQEMCFRKGVGTEDVSGDYNVYEKTETVKVGASTVTFKGNGGLVNLAVWTDGADSYSIMVREQGIPQEQMQELVAALS